MSKNDKKKLTVGSFYKKLTVEQKYKMVLKEIEKIIGNQTTFLSDIQYLGKKLFGIKFKGCYASDMIPKLTDLQPYAILNLDKSYEVGSHWISICKIPNKHEIMLYDSFGRSSVKIIPDIYKSHNGKILRTEKDAEQKKSEYNCGARSLSFIVCFDMYGSECARLI